MLCSMHMNVERPRLNSFKCGCCGLLLLLYCALYRTPIPPVEQRRLSHLFRDNLFSTGPRCRHHFRNGCFPNKNCKLTTWRLSACQPSHVSSWQFFVRFALYLRSPIEKVGVQSPLAGLQPSERLRYLAICPLKRRGRLLALESSNCKSSIDGGEDQCIGRLGSAAPGLPSLIVHILTFCPAHRLQLAALGSGYRSYQPCARARIGKGISIPARPSPSSAPTPHP